MEYYLTILVLLIFCHFLADYPLQGNFLAQVKNKFKPVEGTPWYQAMVAHCFIHASFVMLITNSLLFFVVEFVIHFITDHAKCAGYITYNKDQAIHILTKTSFVAVMVLTAT